MHYIDEGAGEIILFVHGTPSWSFDFRNVIKNLRHQYRCIAIDHIGFGLSSKPEHYDYTTINHSQTLAKFVRQQNLKDVTLVAHDFGGPIGLAMAMQHPEQIKNMVVLNSWLWSSAQEPEFIKLSKILKSPVLPFLYRYLNFSPRFLLPQSFGDKKLPKALRSYYTRPFAEASQRNGTLAFARSLLHDQKWFESLWQNRHILASKPILFIWGMKDKLITPAYLQKFVTGFPNNSVIELSTCGHFPQEEQPEEVANEIRQFLTEANKPVEQPNIGY